MSRRDARRMVVGGPKRAAIVGAIAAASALMPGCSGDDGQDTAGASTDRRSSEAEETTSSTYASVEDEIVARYQAYWDARWAANSPPNPDDPALQEYATGEQLEQVLRETQENYDDGVAFREAENPADFQRVEVVDLSGDTAVVQECVVSDGVVYRRETGEVIDDRVSTYNVRGEMQRVDGEWRLASATAVQDWEGVAGCAVAA